MNVECMNHQSHTDQEIEGILDKIVYSNQENTWCVAKISLNNQTITAVGNLYGTQTGEYVRLKGNWVIDKEYGRQFKIEAFTALRPVTLKGIERYLGSGVIKGIGKEMSKRLVERFGMEVIDIIENNPQCLTRVPGIGKAKARHITEAWKKQKDIKDVMIFLQSYGVSSTYAIKIYKTYGSDALSVVQQDPYRLATDIYGIGFKTADKIAIGLGISPHSPKRIQAGILFVLGELIDKGHVCYPYHVLCDEAASVLNVSVEAVFLAVEELIKRGFIVAEKIGQDKIVYLKSIYLTETGIAKRIKTLSLITQRPIQVDSEKAMSWFEGQQRIKLAPEQKEAVARAIKEKIVVITGGPGTGKTTLVRAIIAILEKKGVRIHLCAPTGRAAKRLGIATGHHAKTIHRLLEFNPVTMKFEKDAAKPLNTDMVIVDEVSMVDVVMFYSILKALPDTAQLVLVGDVDQIPSVGPGNVLEDIIMSNMIPVVRLSTVFRQAKKSLIVVNAHRINQGLIPYFKTRHEKGDFFFIQRDSPSEALETIKELVAEKIPKEFNLDPINDIQIISPMHKGDLGVVNLNKELQSLLNPDKEGIFRSGQLFCVGDKVMQMRNNYEVGVFNGDVGQITSIDPKEKEVFARFDARTVRFEYPDIDELGLAYACSIHKSQGSEYPAVIIPLHTQHYIMLQRNLLYTAVTRGKSLVMVVGNLKALSMAIKTIKRNTRITFLKERLSSIFYPQ